MILTNQDKLDILNSRLNMVNYHISKLEESLVENSEPDPIEKKPRTEVLSDFINFKNILIGMINDFTGQ